MCIAGYFQLVALACAAIMRVCPCYFVEFYLYLETCRFIRYLFFFELMFATRFQCKLIGVFGNFVWFCSGAVGCIIAVCLLNVGSQTRLCCVLIAHFLHIKITVQFFVARKRILSYNIKKIRLFCSFFVRSFARLNNKTPFVFNLPATKQTNL